MYQYTTQGSCAHTINFDIADGLITHAEFIGGCRGNAQGMARLLIGMTPQAAIEQLKGIPCRGNTSCPDQFAQAMEAYLRAQDDQSLHSASD